MYKDIPVISVDEIINKAFSRSSRSVGKGKGIKAIYRKESDKVDRSARIIMASLDKVVSRYPSFSKMDGFNREMFDILVGLAPLKNHLAVLTHTIGSIYRVRSIALKKMERERSSEKIVAIRQEAYGKYNSHMQRIRPSVAWLNDAREKIIEIPPVSSDNYNVVIAGFPNVGKSSLLGALTTSRPVVASYPFTTTGINMGTFELKYQRIFVIDTPGLLDRPLYERNEIEQKAVSAIRFLADLLVFVYDGSDLCSYPLAEQERLRASIVQFLGTVPVIDVYNKVDESSQSIEADAYVSAKTGEGIPELRAALEARILSDPVFITKRSLALERQMGGNEPG
ncbi:MAG: 50S ribosome-binding GTPase [Candidatus Methanofastidiosa archaeon]|nr:50S ribosome-binding GTPase [Candidatus Methanofastidiosa archaeon]